jgi:ankyrin repeat protein
LISKGADLEIKDENFGETPLQIAVQNIDNKEVIERLLKHKANIEARNKQGFTTLQLAITIPALEHIEMVELLT